MKQTNTVVLADQRQADNAAIISALAEHYTLHTLSSAESAFQTIESIMPDILLLNADIPDAEGYALLSLIKEKPETARIPVILITGSGDSESELKGLTLGAADYIAKPFSPALLLKRMEIHLLAAQQSKRLREYGNVLEKAVEQKIHDVLDLENTILRTVAGLVERRDDVTGGHIERTKRYLHVFINEITARGLYTDEMKNWDVNLLVLSSQLHDVGKISIRDDILQKPGKLTEEEFEEIKRHTVFGGKVIGRIQEQTAEHEFLTYAKILAECHHERWDGKGYPLGLAGNDIPLQARMMTIVNVYDALISKRSYKKPFAHEEALRLISESSGTEFDPALVEVFMEASERFRDEYKKMKAEHIVMHADDAAPEEMRS